MIKKCSILFLLMFCCLFSHTQNKDLDFYLSTAVSNSPLLNDYRNQLLINTVDSQVLLASRKIQVTGNGNSFYAPIINGFGYDAAITNGGQLQALATATKSLLPKKYLGYQYRDIQLTGDSLKIASKISEQDLKQSIIVQYITVFADQLQIDFNAELQNLLKKEELMLKTLTQRNVYKQVDYLSFLVTLQQQNLTYLQLKAQYKDDFATLNYIAGIYDTAVTALASPDTSVITNHRKEDSPFFLKFAIDSLRLINNKSLVSLGYRPHINLFADGGYQSSFITRPYKNFGTSIGVSFIVPIYDGRQKNLQYIKLAIAERTRLKNKEFFEARYNQQIAQLQQQLSAIEDLLDPINRQMKYTETLIAANQRLLQTGDIKMTDYVLSINNLIAAKNLLVQNTISRYRVISQLNYWNR